MMGVLVAHHLRWLLAARDVLATALLAALVVALVALLALHDAAERVMAASATLWLVVGLGGVLVAARVLAAEEGGGGLRGVLLSPLNRRDLYLARSLASAVVVLVLASLAWGGLAALFGDLPHLRGVALAPVVVLGALGLGLVGTLCGWASLSTRAGELLAPVLAVPLCAPLLIACLHATSQALTTGALWGPSLTFALGYDVAVGALAYLVADRVVEVR